MLPIEVDVSKLEMGDVIDVLPYDGKLVKNGETVAEFKLKSDVLFRRSARRLAASTSSSAARSPPRRASSWACLPPPSSACPVASRVHKGLHAGSEDGWPRRRPA